MDHWGSDMKSIADSFIHSASTSMGRSVPYRNWGCRPFKALEGARVLDLDFWSFKVLLGLRRGVLVDPKH